MYEKLLYNQLSDHMVNIFNVILSDFRNARSTQHALFKLLLSWQKELDENGMVSVVLMDLSQVYGCILRDLLIAKLNVYGTGSVVLLLISNYLSHRKQRTKLDSSYSYCRDIIKGVPQGSL